jgi:hypothetical protein
MKAVDIIEYQGQDDDYDNEAHKMAIGNWQQAMGNKNRFFFANCLLLIACLN